MIILLEKAGDCLSLILKESGKKNGKVVIFVGFDIDSLCTLRILVTLLRGEKIRYEIIPAMNYNQLDSKLEELGKSYMNSLNDHGRDIKAMIMINCGGTRDLSKMWFCEEECNVITLLIDVHRPANHNNIHSEKISVIDDGLYELENCPKEEDMEALRQEDDLEEEELIEDAEEKEENQENTYGDDVDPKEEDVDSNNTDTLDKPKKRIKKKKENLDTITEHEDSEDEVDYIIDQVKEKKKTKSAEIDEKILKLRLKKKKKMMISSYYGGNYFGFPAAYIAYKMASQNHKEDTQMLWLLIVAITDHYLRAHVSQKFYEELHVECTNEMYRLNPGGNNLPENNKRKVKKEEPMQSNNNDDKDSNLVEDKYKLAKVKVKTNNIAAKSIMIDHDYRLFLYRHWNLYDSLIYSNYTAAHLRTWGEPGKEEVKRLFTYIGVPLNEAKQKYIYMNNDFKNLFVEKINTVSKMFHLKDLIFPSFLYQFDQITQLSASDFVYCLSALLEYPYPITMNDGVNEEEDTSVSTSDSINKDYDLDEELENRNQYKFHNFWTSYDFLSLKSLKMHKIAIDLAIKFQKSLVRNGTLIIDKRIISVNKNFRYAIINTELEEGNYFQHPINFEKLALFIMDTYHINIRKELPKKPFLLALLNKEAKKYLVGGVLGNARNYDQEKSEFAVRFKVTADRKGANLMLNNFDECIVEIDENDFHAFMELVQQV